MRMRAAASCLCWLALVASASAQTHPESLATLFEDVYGPNGLVLNSDDVLLDGSTHAAHFNSAFQSDFRLVNIALTSQLAGIPLPSPASGFTYKFDSGTGTFVRSTNSFGPILSDRAETIGRGRIAFGFTSQFFSFDHLDGVALTDIPAVFRHDGFEAGGGRADVVSTANMIQASVSQFAGALTYGVTDRIDVSLAVPLVRTQLSLLSNAQIYRLGTGSNVQVHYFRDDLAIGGYGSTHQYFIEGSDSGIGDLLVRTKTTLMREGTRAFAAGVDIRVPTGDEQNLLGAGAGGVRPFAAFSSSYARVFAARQPRVPVERPQRPGRRCPREHQGTAPRPVHLCRRRRPEPEQPLQHRLRRPRPARAGLTSAVDLHPERERRRRQRLTARHPVLDRILLGGGRRAGLQGERRVQGPRGIQPAIQHRGQRPVGSHRAAGRRGVGVLNPRGFAPRTPLHAPSLAAAPARSGRVARSHARSRCYLLAVFEMNSRA